MCTGALGCVWESCAHQKLYPQLFQNCEWSHHCFLKASFTSKRNSWAIGPKALLASKMLQKVPIKSFSNSFCQPWAAEMAVLKHRTSSCVAPCTVSLKMWKWGCPKQQWLTHQVWDLTLSWSPLCGWAGSQKPRGFLFSSSLSWGEAASFQLHLFSLGEDV